MMFVVLGIITSLIGVATFVMLPNTPMQARFRTEGEKTALLNPVVVN